MLLIIDRESGIRIFDQIYNQIVTLIVDGMLDQGTILPSTRQLAKTLGVNRSTVIRVYEELGAQGYVESTPGSYTVVRRRRLLSSNEVDQLQNSPDLTLFNDQLGLPYDLMFSHLENEESIGKESINFLRLSPDTRLLEGKDIRASLRDALNGHHADPFDFTLARGFKPLRQQIVRQMKLHSVFVEDENILVTNGSLQSLQLIFQVFSKPGDAIVVENPTYSILLLIAKIFKLEVIEIEISRNGLDLDRLEEVFKEKSVRFVYVMPTYQNPTGLSLSAGNRERLYQLCEHNDCILIEDSTEEELKYSGRGYVPVKALDKKGQIIYLGAYTKVLAPGLRLGWIAASIECIKKLTVVKSVFDISSGSLNQMFLYHFIIRGAFDRHLQRSIRVYKRRMKVAVLSIKEFIPADRIEWIEPYGGYMIWLKLLTLPIKSIESHFLAFGVLIHNGRYFFVKEPENNYIRICIAQTNESEIREGIKRIGEAIRVL